MSDSVLACYLRLHHIAPIVSVKARPCHTHRDVQQPRQRTSSARTTTKSLCLIDKAQCANRPKRCQGVPVLAGAAAGYGRLSAIGLPGHIKAVNTKLQAGMMPDTVNTSAP